ncbi:MAG: helix-turn-helix domain-containing protein [Bryobacteraceae bacterium]
MGNPAIDALVEAIADRVVTRFKAELSHLAPARVHPALLDVKDAAIYIGRSEQAVQHLIFQHDLPVVRVGRRVHIDRRDLDAWIEKNKY